MDQQKQIEEMAYALLEIVKDIQSKQGGVSALGVAEALYTAGYQRKSDTAKEIFDDVSVALCAELHKAFEHSYIKDVEAQRRIARGVISSVASTLAQIEKRYIPEVPHG